MSKSQSQASLSDQLDELVQLARNAGLYDAQDWLIARRTAVAKGEARCPVNRNCQGCTQCEPAPAVAKGEARTYTPESGYCMYHGTFHCTFCPAPVAAREPSADEVDVACEILIESIQGKRGEDGRCEQCDGEIPEDDENTGHARDCFVKATLVAIRALDEIRRGTPR